MKKFITILISIPFLTMGFFSTDVNSQQEIEEIVVSATKRDESLQDVNIAINAFNNEDLNQLNWDDITNVANQAPNVDVKYAIEHGDRNGYFSINSTTGVLTLAKDLDREMVDDYSILVSAEDGGDPVRSSSVNVNVIVMDENDNRPKILNEEFYLMTICHT